MSTGARGDEIRDVDEDLEGLHRYLEERKDLPDDTPREAPRDVPTDESGAFFIGREFTPEGFAAWFRVQGLGSEPFNAVGIHHTWSPTAQGWQGVKTLNNIFNYYRDQYGWPEGLGPHLWLYDGTGGYRPGQPLVYVGTHPAHDGAGIKYRNRRWLHIEAVGNFDPARMPPPMEDLYRFVLQVVCDQRGIPLEDCAGRQVDNPAQPLGLLFHRDAPEAGKSCPGNATQADWFFPSMQRRDALGAFGVGEVQIIGSGEAYNANSPLVGAPRATPEQAYGFLLARGVEPGKAAAVVRAYAADCALAGLDFALALAQCVHETTDPATRVPITSWWSSPPRHNMAGIGVTGEDRQHADDGAPEWQPSEDGRDYHGYRFPDYPAGIRAHVVHLAAYAFPEGAEPEGIRPHMNEAADPRLPALNASGWRGAARTLADLTGKWAADPGYAPRIVPYANAIAAAAPEPLPAEEETSWQAPTGHWVIGRFLSFWRGHPDALTVFGYPVSGEYFDAESGFNYQWFERARFERRPDSDEVSLGRVGAELAALKGIPGATP